MDKELSNKEFMGRLEHAGILKAVAISRNLEGFRDAKGLRHLVSLVPRSTHLSFFFWRIDRHLGRCGQQFPPSSAWG